MTKPATRKRRQMMAAGFGIAAIAAAGVAVVTQNGSEPGPDEVSVKTWVTFGR